MTHFILGVFIGSLVTGISLYLFVRGYINKKKKQLENMDYGTIHINIDNTDHPLMNLELSVPIGKIIESKCCIFDIKVD